MHPIAMEADAAYQECLLSCELHSRSLAVGCTGTSDLEIAHMCYAILRLPAQSRDSKNVQRNLKIAQIPRLHGTNILWSCKKVPMGGAPYKTAKEVGGCSFKCFRI